MVASQFLIVNVVPSMAILASSGEEVLTTSVVTAVVTLFPTIPVSVGTLSMVEVG